MLVGFLFWLILTFNLFTVTFFVADCASGRDYHTACCCLPNLRNHAKLRENSNL